MSKATVEQALAVLVPTWNGPLPPELLELAVSLLSRSRSVAHSLKSDEEIARPYACAHLACERRVLPSQVMSARADEFQAEEAPQSALHHTPPAMCAARLQEVVHIP